MGVRVAIAGASGYAGGELLRLVATHPDLDVVSVTAHGNAGQRVGELHPNLRSVAELVFAETSADVLRDADLVFLALPHGAAGALAGQLPESLRIVDLGSDHRLVDPAAHERYYGGAYHPAWTYGLPELPGQRAQIARARRVANTGCHAVAAILAIAPLVAAGLADPDDVVVTSASGTSGAGKAVLPHLLGSEVMGDLTGYKVGAHRHVPEIKQASGARSLTMTPVLAPMPRGILASVALRPATAVHADGVRAALADAYRGEPFVHVLPAGQQPRTAATAGSNSAHLQAAVDTDSGRIVVTCAIDNLGKGAAGQAVQIANIMLGLTETAGLAVNGVAP
ncbi:MAG TPA: N-acetyl-gamma-glutamyl-phosphate reductase [Jatrophihabitans sp.]|nr:N-acetyl-gamma-glutamyl-phosphate reductase [Jatrophihabitans sp.]